MRLTAIAASLMLCTGLVSAAGTVQITGGDFVASGFNQTSNDPLTGLSNSGSGTFCCDGTSQYAVAAAGGFSNGSLTGTHSGFGNATNVGVFTTYRSTFVLASATNQGISVSLNLVYRASTDGGTCAGDTFQVTVDDPNFGSGSVALINPGTVKHFDNGFTLPAPTGAPIAFTTGTATLATNTVQNLALTFSLLVGSGGSSCIISGSGSFSFPTSGPVFNLPAGVTVDIPELNIVDNHWHDPRVGVAPPSVNYGSVNVGAMKGQIVTVTNQQTLQNQPLALQSVTVDSPSNGFFVQSVSATSIPVGQTADIDVRFAPSATGPASNVLHIVTSASSIDIPLSGTGTNTTPPAQQQITDILSFFDSSVQSGALMGSGSGHSATGRLGALRNMIEAAGTLIQQGRLADACVQLKDAVDRTDGNPTPPDFVTGTAAATLMQKLQAVRATLGCA